MIGIISYYPDNEYLRTRRIQAHKNQIDWLANLFKDEKITIVSQNYNETDYIIKDNIQYIKYDKGIGPGKARNVILEKFYNSNDDTLFLLDDDIMMYNYYNVTPLLLDFYYNSSNYKMDAIIPNNPEFMPFKKFIYEKTDYKNYYTFKKVTLNCCPNALMIKNINKLKDIKLYYEDVKFDKEDCVAEDMLFVASLLYNGFKIYQCINWIKKSPNRNNSTIFADNKINSKLNKQLHKKLIENTINKLRILYDIKDINFNDKFNKLYNNYDMYINIKRFEPYELEVNLLPDYKQSKNNLF